MNQQDEIFGEPERESTFFLDEKPQKQVRKTSAKHSSDISTSKPLKNGKKTRKNEHDQDTLSKRAERMDEDPFATDTEKLMDGSSKEKPEKVTDKEEVDPKRELRIMAARADKVLLQAKALFPYDLFGSTITIDANKVNIRLKTFFMTETVTSIMLKEIMDVRVNASLMFGQLVIDYGPHPLKISTVYISHLRKEDALKAKEIIEGILVLYRGENIDTTKLKPEETMDQIKEIGKVEERE